MNRFASWFCIAGIFSAFALLSTDLSATRAATISYGDFGPWPPGIQFLDIDESSSTDPVPLYGPPYPDLFGGNVGFDFNPVSFGAMSENGGDIITNGQLDFIVTGRVVNSTTGVGIAIISISEGGFFSLDGISNAFTSVQAAASTRVKILEIDGIPIASPLLLSISDSVAYNLVAHPGFLQPWSLGVAVPISAYLFRAGIPFSIGVTKVEVTIDTQLAASSRLASSSSINITDIGVAISPVVVGSEIPEPGTFALAVVALCGVAHRVRRVG